jgi:hypothetical protein
MDDMKYSILLLTQSTPKWLSFSKEYRNRIFSEIVYPLLQKYTDRLNIQVFSAEAFHANVSDYLLVETIDMEYYYRFIQELKSSKIFSEELFILKDVIVSSENGFREFNEKFKAKQHSTSLN